MSGLKKSQLVLGFAAALLLAEPIAAAHENELPHAPGAPFAARNLPDRIVLTPGANPAREMAVAFRTDPAQAEAEAQIAIALDGPSLEARAQAVKGVSVPLDAENGASVYHQVRFTGLKPDTAYVYRVKGAAGWSEWLQFRTASEDFQPFSFLYFGDIQNDILSVSARVIRAAFHETAGPALAVHAGDLVNQRETKAHDDEWGEWTAAGGFNFSMIPQIPAAGNHEFVDIFLPDGSESRKLGKHWTATFALPDNGAEPVKETTYFVDYQGVRFIVLDATSALELGSMEAQTLWLEKNLAESDAKWKIVMFHQPLFTCARPDGFPPLQDNWKPLFDAHRVDLVLQGHDHCYARMSNPAGKGAAAKAQADGDPQGPVYVVSVAGSKMYSLKDRAQTEHDRAAEDTQLYQVIDIEEETLRFRSFTATGLLYDGFELRRAEDGFNRLVETTEPLAAVRTCAGRNGPDGLPCVARGK